MPHTDMCQEGLLLLTEICAKPNVEVKASIMDIQQVIPLHIKQWM